MNHFSMQKAVAALLLSLLLFSSLVACGGGGENGPSSSEEKTPGGQTTEEPTSESTTEEGTKGENMTEESTVNEGSSEEASTEEATTAPPVPQNFTVEGLIWSLGYVGSDTHASYNEKLNPGGGMYSYSDIIDLGPAGSTITFTDDNTNSNGDNLFASAAAYVFSSWKEENGEWVIDKSGYKASGTTATYTEKGSERTYTYTSQKDNECIRISFRSGQSASFTPAAFPIVTVHSTVKPMIRGREVYTPEGTELKVNWNTGYVGSAQNSYGYANKLNTGESKYSYSDVIELKKKGSKISFLDTKKGAGSANAYVVSFWTKSGDSWAIDTGAENLLGGNEFVMTTTALGTLYTYISSKDNEYVRFCFRSEGIANAPKIYLAETNETGTHEAMHAEENAYLDWIEADKNRAFYDILKGKTFTVIGDSYFAGNGLDRKYVWPAMLAKKYDMVFQNYGKNGSTMSNYVTTNNPMVNRYTEMAKNDPDIVIIEGGRNDYNKNVPIGEDGSTDTKTMKGAARYLITKVKEMYPNALVICLTPWEVGGSKNAAGNYCSDYGKALLKVCEDMGVPCINAMDSAAMGVYMTDSSFRAEYCMGPNDISHLNAKGMKKVLPVFEKYIAELYAKKQ